MKISTKPLTPKMSSKLHKMLDTFNTKEKEMKEVRETSKSFETQVLDRLAALEHQMKRMRVNCTTRATEL